MSHRNIVLSACMTQPMNQQATAQDKNHAAVGAIIGAVAGAVVGGQLDDDGKRDKGVILGALVGAAAVADYLIDSGIAASLIESAGRGAYEPRESNVTKAGRALNRRVEIFI